MRVRTVLVGGTGALLAALALLLAGQAQRRAGTNRIPNPSFVAVIGAGDGVCQTGELVPAGTAALEMTIGTYYRPGPSVRVSARDLGGRLVTQGRLSPGWRQGAVSIPVHRVRASRAGVTVCLRNDGSTRIALAGVADPGGTGAELQFDHRSKYAALRIDYLRPGRESWFALLGTIAHRMTVAKGGYIAAWCWFGALVAMLTVGVLAARILLAEERRP